MVVGAVAFRCVDAGKFLGIPIADDECGFEFWICYFVAMIRFQIVIRLVLW